MDTIAPGQSATASFTIDAAAMQAFAELSGDRSAVHVDDAAAKARGYDGVIVYGGLMLAKLSGVLGGLLPGDDGVSASWRIDYRSPLYVGEAAVLRLEVTHVSPGAGLVDARFSIHAGERLIASGKTQSLVPAHRLPAP